MDTDMAWDVLEMHMRWAERNGLVDTAREPTGVIFQKARINHTIQPFIIASLTDLTFNHLQSIGTLALHSLLANGMTGDDVIKFAEDVVRKREAEREAASRRAKTGDREAASRPAKTAAAEPRAAAPARPADLNATNLALVATTSRKVPGWLAGLEAPEEVVKTKATSSGENGNMKTRGLRGSARPILVVVHIAVAAQVDRPFRAISRLIRFFGDIELERDAGAVMRSADGFEEDNDMFFGLLDKNNYELGR
ncbi:hypothetical protein C8A01DRAFT_40079, partial [Parachaetomium inaequale]